MTEAFRGNLLKTLVETNSIYPREQQIGDLLTTTLREKHFDVFHQDIGDGRKNIFAVRGKGGKAVLFYGHMDTVPLTNEKEWQTDPFRLTEKDGNYYGLGAYDMKGGLASFLEATKNTDAYVKLFLAVDEENISEGAWQAVKERKGFFEDVELIISAEPNFGLGLHGITVGRTGRCVYKIPFNGTPKHVIKYKEAVDAIEKLARFISALYDKREQMFKSGETVVFVRKVSGESTGMSICGKATVEVEALLGHLDSVEKVILALQKFAGTNVSLKPRKTPYLEGYHFSTFPYQEIIEKIIKDNTNHQMTFHTRTSVGDDNVLAGLGISVITWGADGDNAHAPNEYVNIKSLNVLTKMYQQFLELKS